MIRLALLAGLLLGQAAPALAGDAPDPGRMTAARSIAARLLPEASYTQLSQSLMQQLAAGVLRPLMDAPVRETLAANGLTARDMQQVPQAVIQQVQAIVDPAHQQRYDRALKALMPELTPALASAHPALRESLAAALGRRFDRAQLEAFGAYLATPSGAAIGPQLLLLNSDPGMAAAMQAALPAALKVLPAAFQKVAPQLADLPKPRAPAQLTPAERAKIAELLAKKG